MQLLELPTELFDGIIDQVVRDEKLYFTCRLREVNSTNIFPHQDRSLTL